MWSQGLNGIQSGDFVHVSNHAVEGSDLFPTDADRRAFLREVRAARTDDVDIVAWSLVRNHYHMLLKILGDPAAMASFIQQFQARYAINHNVEYGRRGALHWRRYNRGVVGSDAGACVVTAYIHANRVKDGFCQDPATDPWSSHLDYLDLRRDKAASLVDLAYRDQLFGGTATYAATFAELLPRWTTTGPQDVLYRAVLRHMNAAIREQPHLLTCSPGLRCAALVEHAGLSAYEAAKIVGIKPNNGARTVRRARRTSGRLLAAVGERLKQVPTGLREDADDSIV
jgi:putative transposase